VSQTIRTGRADALSHRPESRMGRQIDPPDRDDLLLQNNKLRLALVEQDAARRHYARLFEQAPVGYLTLADSGAILQANRTAAALFGRAVGELAGQLLERFIHADDRALFRRHFAEPPGAATPRHCELRMEKADRTVFWAQLCCTGKAPGNDEALCLVTFGDITASKQAEQALQDQKDFFHLIAENLSDFIAVLDLEGRRLYNSPSYRQLFGTDRDVHDSDSFAEIHPDDRDYVRQVFRETVHTGQGRRIEYRFLTAEGEIRDMESRGSVIKDEHGRVVRVVVVSQDITERKRLQEQVRQMAFHDPLTGLPNRRLFDDRFNQALATTSRSNDFGALIFIDLDDFKRLNDSHGHNAGDHLLVEVASRLKRCVRETDTVARFGGDEFVVMLGMLDTARRSSLVQARAIAEKLRQVLAEPYRLSIAHSAGGVTRIDYSCTASIGVALFNQRDTSQPRVLKRADSAMYQAKSSGGNQIRFCRGRG
jgi:diguanylate cyclase (GGDEF)-like protein/PAS domain S-box-containing protein